jgi:hypothetical protein
VIGIGALFGIEMMGGGREIDGEEEEEEEERRKEESLYQMILFRDPRRGRDGWGGGRG